MALSFLPEDKILPIHHQIDLKFVLISAENMNSLAIFKKYMRRRWVNVFLVTNSLFLFSIQNEQWSRELPW